MKSKKILILDNYDSFTYNLVHAIKSLGYINVDVIRNDKIDLTQVASYDKIVLSPGPGLPGESGLMPQIIEKFGVTRSILGVCLGHQAIAEAFGARLKNLTPVFHGVQTSVNIIGEDYILNGIPTEFEAGRYHSWIVSKDNFPEELIITAVDGDDNIMALKHKTYDLHGVQFHPESILTPMGIKIIKNFLE